MAVHGGADAHGGQWLVRLAVGCWLFAVGLTADG